MKRWKRRDPKPITGETPEAILAGINENAKLRLRALDDFIDLAPMVQQACADAERIIASMTALRSDRDALADYLDQMQRASADAVRRLKQ